jgi:hypothetical protein
MTMTKTNSSLGRVLENLTVASLAKEFVTCYETRSLITVYGQPRSEWTKMDKMDNKMKTGTAMIVKIDHPVTIGSWAGWNREPVWTFGRTGKLLILAGNRTRKDRAGVCGMTLCI